MTDDLVTQFLKALDPTQPPPPDDSIAGKANAIRREYARWCETFILSAVNGRGGSVQSVRGHIRVIAEHAEELQRLLEAQDAS